MEHKRQRTVFGDGIIEGFYQPFQSRIIGQMKIPHHEFPEVAPEIPEVLPGESERRDKIPEIIEQEGKKALTRIMEEEEYTKELEKKLNEELDEYKLAQTSEQSLEELADILEIIYALGEIYGASKEELEELRKEKAEKRGGFKEKIKLIEVEE